MKGHTKGVSAVTASPDGAYIVSGSWDDTIKVWDAATGREIFTLCGHTGGIRAVGVTPDCLRILSDSNDGTLRVWDAQDGRELQRFKSHNHYEAYTHGAASVPITADGRYVISDTDDRMLALWDVRTGQCLLRFPRSAGVDHVATVEDLVVAGDQAGAVHILKICSLDFGPRIVTARRRGAAVVYQCPYCCADNDAREADRGSEVTCCRCDRRVKLNSTVAESSRPARWWRRLLGFSQAAN
jgi:WD40 repeat protein